MSNTWVLDVEPNVFAIVKYGALKELTDFPSTFFTMDSINNSESVFPTVYIHFLQGVEIGQTLEGQDINGMNATVDVQITVSKEQGSSVARRVTDVVMEQFKQLGFSIYSLPEFNGNTNDTKRMVFRARRIIGANDTL